MKTFLNIVETIFRIKLCRLIIHNDGLFIFLLYFKNPTLLSYICEYLSINEKSHFLDQDLLLNHTQ